MSHPTHTAGYPPTRPLTCFCFCKQLLDTQDLAGQTKSEANVAWNEAIKNRKEVPEEGAASTPASSKKGATGTRTDTQIDNNGKRRRIM